MVENLTPQVVPGFGTALQRVPRVSRDRAADRSPERACRREFPPPLVETDTQVLQDMLKLLKESVNSSHGEHLEAIVIVLM